MAAQAKQKQEALQEQEIQLKMAEQKAKTDKTEAEARKANAEADRAEIEAQILKQKLAEAHMGSIRNIEEHDHAIEDMVQDRHHAQDAHGADHGEPGPGRARCDGSSAGPDHDRARGGIRDVRHGAGRTVIQSFAGRPARSCWP
jgi:hypothetical protein